MNPDLQINGILRVQKYMKLFTYLVTFIHLCKGTMILILSTHSGIAIMTCDLLVLNYNETMFTLGVFILLLHTISWRSFKIFGNNWIIDLTLKLTQVFRTTSSGCDSSIRLAPWKPGIDTGSVCHHGSEGDLT